MVNVSLRAPAHLVSSRARWLWAVRALLGWLVVLGIEVAVSVGPDNTGDGMWIVLGITSFLALAHLSVMPQWRYRVHRWEATDTAVYTQSGWFAQERRIAPIARIQTVDTERGPFDQLFGLADVRVTTASAAGPLKIHGLDRAVADRLVDDLTRRTNATDGDGT